MNVLIEAKVIGGFQVLLDPHAVAWVRSTCEGKALVGTMASTNVPTATFWCLDCTYDEFKMAWSDALNYVKRFGDAGGGVISI